MTTRDTLIGFLDPPDPLAAAAAAGVEPGVITWSRAPAPAKWLVDDEDEGAIDAHHAAHADGRSSEAVVRYGAGIAPAHVVDRLLALGTLSRQTGRLAAVRLMPAEGTDGRPGSWGVEDLAVTAVARLALSDGPLIRVDWRLVGAAAAQVAASFGATDWQIPADDTADPDHLAAAIGCTAEERTA
jgi:hypothetical protein